MEHITQEAIPKKTDIDVGRLVPKGTAAFFFGILRADM